MTELAGFLRLGIHHILAPNSLDHLLFLLALVAPFRFRDWRHLLTVTSAFTVGHSLTLALVATTFLRPPAALIELLIPLTIVAASLANLRRTGRPAGSPSAPLLAGLFGLIHGAGFASVLRTLFSGPIALPLFGFNLGIELGQLVVLATALVLLSGADRMLRVRGTVALTSLAAAAGGLLLAVQRLPR